MARRLSSQTDRQIGKQADQPTRRPLYCPQKRHEKCERKMLHVLFGCTAEMNLLRMGSSQNHDQVQVQVQVYFLSRVRVTLQSALSVHLSVRQSVRQSANLYFFTTLSHFKSSQVIFSHSISFLVILSRSKSFQVILSYIKSLNLSKVNQSFLSFHVFLSHLMSF